MVSSFVTSIFNESDHALLVSEFSCDSLKFGPGLPRVNATLLDDAEIKIRIINEVKNELINSNPHETLDHYKYLLRKNMLREGKIKMKKEKTSLELSNAELDKLKTKLDRLLIKNLDEDLNLAEKKELKKEISNLKEGIEIASEPINKLKDEESKRLIFRSRAKWAEEGEKSNKYFLNLVKERQKRMQIRKIVSNGITYHTQDEISKAINQFYKNLYKKQDNLKPIDENDSLFQNLPFPLSMKMRKRP